MTETFERDVFRRFDALLIASTLTPAPAFSEFDGETPRWTAMRTIPFNVTGHPALAVPSGLTEAGLPLGMQIMGETWRGSLDLPHRPGLGRAFTLPGKCG